MRIPQKPPAFEQLLAEASRTKRLPTVLAAARDLVSPKEYLHWDKLRHLAPPEGSSHREWWLATKLVRSASYRPAPLMDKAGRPFQYAVPDTVVEQLHHIDTGAGGMIGLPDPITNPQTRDQYFMRSLMQEAITSSQLEGAVTTRDVAKEMLRSGRPPRDRSEQMILNNFRTMQRIIALRAEPLSGELVFELHRLVTDRTLPPEAVGRFRLATENIRVYDEKDEILHQPPAAGELAGRMAAMCDFANGHTPGHFVHPVVRAILLHFWLAYDHPFVDGNGRTARALFYWAMLRNGFWLFEFISISSVLLQAPARYALAFLHTETDANDLTYFLVHQTDAIRQAITALHAYIERKSRELRETESLVRHWERLNHRQHALLGHALRHPGRGYTIEGHQGSHNVAYATARSDLLGLTTLGLLTVRKVGRQMVFGGVSNLPAALKARTARRASALD